MPHHVVRVGRALVALAAASIVVLALVGSAIARLTYDFANVTPADQSQIAYADWYAAGSYVRFTIRPDSNYPCNIGIYELLINGRSLGRFSSNCSMSAYIPSPGRYSWRTQLYIYDLGTSVGGPITTFTIAAQPAPPPPPPPPPPPSTSVPSGTQDTTSPVVKAHGAVARVGQLVRLIAIVRDNSGRATFSAGVFRGQRRVVNRTGKLTGVRTAKRVVLAWIPLTAGRYTFCVLATDDAGNVSKTSCAPVTVRA